MHYRHIKRICRGEASTDYLEVIPYEKESAMIGIKMQQNIYTVAYISKACRNIHSYYLNGVRCNYKTDEPIVWFYNFETLARYAVGIKLKDLIMILLEEKSNPIRLGHISTCELFRVFIKHLQWDLKRKNIRQWVDFCGSRKLNSYDMEHHTAEVYSAINAIFIKYIKLLAQWKQK